MCDYLPLILATVMKVTMSQVCVKTCFNSCVPHFGCTNSHGHSLAAQDLVSHYGSAPTELDAPCTIFPITALFL